MSAALTSLSLTCQCKFNALSSLSTGIHNHLNLILVWDGSLTDTDSAHLLCVKPFISSSHHTCVKSGALEGRSAALKVATHSWSLGLIHGSNTAPVFPLSSGTDWAWGELSKYPEEVLPLNKYVVPLWIVRCSFCLSLPVQRLYLKTQSVYPSDFKHLQFWFLSGNVKHVHTALILVCLLMHIFLCILISGAVRRAHCRLTLLVKMRSKWKSFNILQVDTEHVHIKFGFYHHHLQLSVSLCRDWRERESTTHTRWQSHCSWAGQRLASSSATQTANTLPLPLSSFCGAAREGRGMALVCVSRQSCYLPPVLDLLCLFKTEWKRCCLLPSSEISLSMFMWAAFFSSFTLCWAAFALCVLNQYRVARRREEHLSSSGRALMGSVAVSAWDWGCWTGGGRACLSWDSSSSSRGSTRPPSTASSAACWDWPMCRASLLCPTAYIRWARQLETHTHTHIHIPVSLHAV